MSAPRLPAGAAVYLVGGAVRDALLGRPVTERDWVVVGATPDAMRAAGFRQVGRDFPVFLHPETSEEYALARTERKRGHGYTGFEVHCAPDVTLEQDLLRRDLTVNAMAMTERGELVDPCAGRADLDARMLRHVSGAFVEDPLRVLRVARFAARYRPLGFRVAPETLALMGEIVEAGELGHLPAERVWTETDRALGEGAPRVYVELLRACGGLARLLPEVDALFGVPQRPEYHPEIDTGLHTLMVLDAVASLSQDPAVRFACLLHDLGKALTPSAQLPGHRGHDRAGLPVVRAVCERLRVPNRYRDLALVVCEYHLLAHRAEELRPGTLLELLAATGALRQAGERFEGFLLACEADKRGRLGREHADYPPARYLRTAAARAREVTAATVAAPELKGPAIGEAIRAERLRRLAALRA